MDDQQASEADMPPSTPLERICTVVADIPSGTVASYGQVAQLAGLPGAARMVGRVLATLPADSRLPWHRVVNAAGGSSLPGSAGSRQRQLLAAEGVLFRGARVDMGRCRWQP